MAAAPDVPLGTQTIVGARPMMTFAGRGNAAATVTTVASVPSIVWVGSSMSDLTRLWQLRAARAAEGGACRRLLQAPFAGAVEDAWADPEPHYGHYSLHVSLAAIFARDVGQTNPLLTGGLA